MSEPPATPRRARNVSRYAAAGLTALAAFALIHTLVQRSAQPRFLTVAPESFVALFPAPPAADSPATRRELDELLDLQARRTPAEVTAARADRKTRIERFAGALGLEPARMAQLDALNTLAEQVEDDIRPFVRAAKDHFHRLRPYEIEPRLSPCIDNVRGDLSYPSGHATYGYAMALMLMDLVPERAPQLSERAREFAHQRMVCGVHFSSDIDAGREGASWLVQRILKNPDYPAASAAARRELRGALGLASEAHALPRPTG